VRPHASLTLFLVSGLVFLPACRSVFRSPVEVRDDAPAVDQALLEGMNPLLLAEGVGRGLFVEIDWVAGEPPSPRSVEALQAVLRRHAPAGAAIEVLLDEEIPQTAIASLEGRSGLERLVAEQFDGEPVASNDRELLYLLYLPSGEPFYGGRPSGMLDTVRLATDGEAGSIPVILLFTDEIRRDAVLWVNAAKVERATLVHELGHLLGLVSNPEHTQRGHPHHCTEPQCVMNRPHAGSSFYNAPAAFFLGRIPDDYCRRCRADIERVQELWRNARPDVSGDPESR
jgi:hypothetical protein